MQLVDLQCDGIIIKHLASALKRREIMSKAIINGESIFSDPEWAEIREGLFLSPREDQIIRGLFADKSDKQIAMDLKISIPTVRTHISRLFRKLKANDRADLILHIFKQFLQNCGKLNCPRLR